MIGIYNSDQAKKIANIVIAKVKKAHEEGGGKQEEILLNRVRFAEVLLLVLETSLAEKGIEDADDMICQELKSLFDRYIVTFLSEKENDTMPTSLNAFRVEYVWRERINTLLEHNLEGIMDVFQKFCEDSSFVVASAEKLFKGIGCLLPLRVIKQQFDLAQMTVIDEENASGEYDDMELVEFLEFLVRIAFQKNIDDETSSMHDKLADLLKEIIGLTQHVYIEPPKHH